MTTYTSRGVPQAEESDPANIADRVNAVADVVHDRPGVSPLTTAQRNALAGAELWPGRVIFNTTTQAHEIYRSDFAEWHEGLEAPGSVKEWPSATIPAGWRKHDGAALSRTTYAALFARIGTTYGAGDGSTTFNLPNRSGRFALGVNGPHPLGQTGGAETHTLTVAEMPAHNHGGATGGQSASHTHGSAVSTTTGFGTAGNGNYSLPASNATNGIQTGTASNDHTHGVNTQGGGGAHNNMPPFVATNVLIKI